MLPKYLHSQNTFPNSSHVCSLYVIFVLRNTHTSVYHKESSTTIWCVLVIKYTIYKHKLCHFPSGIQDLKCDFHENDITRVKMEIVVGLWELQLLKRIERFTEQGWG